MGIKVAVARFTNATTAIDQDITTADLGGLTPKAAIIITSATATDGVILGNARMSVGITDGVSEFVSSWVSRSGQTTTETANVNVAGQLLEVLSTGAGSASVSEARFVSWIPNGIRIFWNNPTTTVNIHTIIFFAGTNLTAKVGAFEAVGPNGTETTVTTGFEPKNIFFMSGGHPFDNVLRGGVWQQLGFANNQSGVVQQGSISHYHEDNAVGVAVNAGIIQNDRISANISQTLSREFELSAFLADGFKVKHYAGADSTSQWHAYLALNYANKASAYVGTKASPTVTGNASNADPGILPQFVMLTPTHMPSLNSLYTDNTVVSYAVSAITSTQEHSTSVADEDGATTTDTESILDDVAIRMRNAIGTADVLVANRVSFDPNGYTLNYTTANAQARQMLVWVVGEGGVSNDLSVGNLDSGSPTVQGVTLGQKHELVSGAVLSGQPTISAPTMTFVLLLFTPKERTISIELELRQLNVIVA